MTKLSKLGEDMYQAIGSIPFIEANDRTRSETAAYVAIKYAEQESMDFFIWLVRVAKIEVIDAEQFLEAHGFATDMVPVLSLKELYEKFKEESGISTPSLERR